MPVEANIFYTHTLYFATVMILRVRVYKMSLQDFQKFVVLFAPLIWAAGGHSWQTLGVNQGSGRVPALSAQRNSAALTRESLEERRCVFLRPRWETIRCLQLVVFKVESWQVGTPCRAAGVVK